MSKLKYMIWALVILCLLSGCSSASKTTAVLQTPVLPDGKWTIGGVLFTGHVVDIDDVPDVKKMYQDGYLQCEDGMAYLGIGDFYAPVHILPPPNAKADMLLQSDFSQIEDSETTPLSHHIDGSYLITILDSDTLLLEEYFESSREKDELPIIFVAEDTESQYILNHKGQPFHQPTRNGK